MDSRGGTGSFAAARLRDVFIVAQVALAFVLLSGAGLLGLSLRRVLAEPPGLRADHILTGRLSISRSQFPDEAGVLSAATTSARACRAT